VQNTEPLIPGWMAKEDLIVIATLAATLGPEDSIVEVGSWMGQSTDCWAAHTQATVYAIDLWEWMPKEYEGPAKSRVNLKGDPFAQFSRFVERHDNIVPLKRSSSGVPWEHEPPAVVFIDAMHQDPWVSDDVAFWQEIVRPGGIICGDDYSNVFPAVQGAAQRCAERFETDLALPGNKFWMVRKPA